LIKKFQDFGNRLRGIIFKRRWFHRSSPLSTNTGVVI
jgi:hypothetical protein